MTTATTILEQLGGNKFIAMTGAKMFVDVGNGIVFKLPKFEGVKINSVKIVLNSRDAYDVEFGNVRGTNYKVLSKSADVYADNLQMVFSNATGLLTKF
jgi:hypothetical protein